MSVPGEGPTSRLWSVISAVPKARRFRPVARAARGAGVSAAEIGPSRVTPYATGKVGAHSGPCRSMRMRAASSSVSFWNAGGQAGDPRRVRHVGVCVPRY